MYTLVDGRNPQTPTSTTPLSSDITFNSAGQLTGITSTGMTVNADKTMTLTGWTPAAVTDSTTSPVTWGANGAAGRPAASAST